VKLAPGQTLAGAQIAAPMRSTGVQFSGTNAHLVIRNLTATHVYNDGFNIHGSSRDVLFENIRAIECGDDGISSHDDCQYRVSGFVSIGNSTGICDTGNSVTSYDRVFIRNCLGHDLYFLDTGRYWISNSVVLSSAARAFVVTGRDQTNPPCRLVLDNVLIRRETGSNDVRVTKNSILDARRCTFLNLSFQATGGEVRLRDSVIAGAPAPEIVLWPGVNWRATGNLYDLRSLRLDRSFYSPQTFADFQRATAGDAGSRWQRVVVADSWPQGIPAGVGADAAWLQSLIE